MIKKNKKTTTSVLSVLLFEIETHPFIVIIIHTLTLKDSGHAVTERYIIFLRDVVVLNNLR